MLPPQSMAKINKLLLTGSPRRNYKVPRVEFVFYTQPARNEAQSLGRQATLRGHQIRNWTWCIRPVLGFITIYGEDLSKMLRLVNCILEQKFKVYIQINFHISPTCFYDPTSASSYLKIIVNISQILLKTGVWNKKFL